MNYTVNQIDLTDICRTFHPTAAKYVFSTVHGKVHRADYRLAHKISFGKPLLLFSYSITSDSAIPWTVACQAPMSFTISWNLLKLMSIESMMPSNHLILCCPLLFLLSIFPSIRVFSNELALHIRSHQSVLSKHKKTDIISNIFSNDNGIKLEITGLGLNGKIHMWKLNNILLNNQCIKE